MVTLQDVSVNELISQLSIELKKIKEITPPEWVDYVKTGAHKERPPVNKDWWYIRVAAIFRSVSNLGPIGVEKLKTKYGGKKNRGHKPERFYKGSGSVVRKSLQQLEAAGLIKKQEKDIHKGRIVTNEGTKLINTVMKKVRG